MSDVPARMPQVECPVQIAPGVPTVGVYANAFRILRDTEGEFLLDFVVYSAATNTATLVSRVRIAHSLIPAIQERMVAMQNPQQGLDLALITDKDKLN